MRRAALRFYCCAVCLAALTLLSLRAAAQQTDPAPSHGNHQRDASRFRLPQGSFINVPCQTVEALVSHVQRNSVVAARYARVFHMSPAAVVEAFKQLKVGTMPEDRITRVYFVHGWTIGYRVRRVKKGTPIFTMPDDTPALVLVCGNPLVTTPVPPLLSQPIPEFGPTFEEAELPSGPERASAPLEAPEEMPVLASPEPGVQDIVESAPVVPPEFVEDTGVLPADRIPLTEAHLTPPIALAMLAAFYATPGLGGGGGFGSVPTPTTPGGGTPRTLPGTITPIAASPPVGPVPEPGPAGLAACAAMAMAATGLLTRARRTRGCHHRGRHRSSERAARARKSGRA